MSDDREPDGPLDRLARRLAGGRLLGLGTGGARRWAVALGLGWLVLMTVWGFGRTADPVHADAWGLGGLIAGGAATTATLRRSSDE